MLQIEVPEPLVALQDQRMALFEEVFESFCFLMATTDALLKISFLEIEHMELIKEPHGLTVLHNGSKGALLTYSPPTKSAKYSDFRRVWIALSWFLFS